jgi:hypothetical protein
MYVAGLLRGIATLQLRTVSYFLRAAPPSKIAHVHMPPVSSAGTPKMEAQLAAVASLAPLSLPSLSRCFGDRTSSFMGRRPTVKPPQRGSTSLTTKNEDKRKGHGTSATSLTTVTIPTQPAR